MQSLFVDADFGSKNKKVTLFEGSSFDLSFLRFDFFFSSIVSLLVTWLGGRLVLSFHWLRLSFPVAFPEYVRKFASIEAIQDQEQAKSDSESSLSDFSENEAQDMEL